MQFNKTWLTKPELFRLYFLLLRAFYIISTLVSLVFTVISFDLFASAIFCVSTIFMTGQFWLSLQAERQVTEKNNWGTLLGLGLALMILVSFGFPVACLGIYSLLNKSHRDNYYPAQLPEWFEKCVLKMDELLATKGSSNEI